MEWQGLVDTMNDGGDWDDYAYIRTIDLQTGKVRRYTDNTWAKKLLKKDIIIFNILTLLEPSEIEKFLDEGRPL